MSGGGTQTTTSQNYSPAEAAQREGVMQEASRIYGATKDTIANSPYPGSQVAAPSAATVGAQQSALDYAAGAGTQTSNLASSAAQFGLADVLNIDSNPYMRQTIDAAIRPITESYTDPGGIMAQIRSGARDAGQFGGSRQGIAEGVAAGRYFDSVGDASAQVANNAYQQGLGTFSNTLGNLGNITQAGLSPSTVMGGVGAQQDTLEQMLKDYEAEAAMWDLNSGWTPLQNYANIVFGGANPTAVSTSKTSSSPLQIIASLASLASRFP